MKSIYIHRNITLQRAGHDDVVLPKGNHTVADDVAEHPFVKHHTSSSTDVEDGAADLQALLDQTRIAAASEIEQLRSDLQYAKDQVQRLDAAQATADEWRHKYNAQTDVLAAAQTTIAERDAALAAHAAMTPAVEPKGKAK